MDARPLRVCHSHLQMDAWLLQLWLTFLCQWLLAIHVAPSKNSWYRPRNTAVRKLQALRGIPVVASISDCERFHGSRQVTNSMSILLTQSMSIPSIPVSSINVLVALTNLARPALLLKLGWNPSPPPQPPIDNRTLVSAACAAGTNCLSVSGSVGTPFSMVENAKVSDE